MSDEREDDIIELDLGEDHSESGHSFYPYHVIETITIAYVLFAVLVTLATFFPFHLHEPADPLVTPHGIKPEWYFLPMYQGIKYVPPMIGVMASGGVFVLIIIWPLIDALVTRYTKWRRFHVFVGVVGLFVALTLAAVGHLSERTVEYKGRTYDIDVMGIPHAVEQGAEQEGEPSAGH